MVSRYIKFTLAVSAINRYIQKIEKNAMAKYGLKGSHAHCIVALTGKPDGITAAELCRFTDKDKAAISRTISELEECGYVERFGDGSNMYRAQLALTESGKMLGEELAMLAGKAVKSADTGIDEDDRKIFYEALDLFAENLEKMSKDGI